MSSRTDELRETGRVTRRQLEVLCLLATGLTSSEAAKRLLISEHTVIRHVTNMGMIVGAGNRLELLALAIIGGLIDARHWPPKPTGQLRLQIAARCFPAAERVAYLPGGCVMGRHVEVIGDVAE
jgi:DNA-binding CsgD family transcriptional regulator